MALITRGLEGESYDRQYDDLALIKRVFGYFLRYKPQLVAIILAVLLMSLQSGLRPVIIALGIDALEGDILTDPFLLAGAFVVAIVIEYASNWVRRRMMSKVIGSVVSQMRKDAFNAGVERDLSFYDEHKSGKIVSRISSDTEEFGQVVLLTSDVANQVVAVVVLLAVLFTRDIFLTFLLLGMVPVILLIAFFFRKYARIVTRDGARAMALVNDNIQESVTGISVAKNFRQEAMIYDEFAGVNKESFRINLRRGFVLSLIFPIMNVLTGIATAIILYAGAVVVTNGSIRIGSWFLFVQGVDRFWFPFTSLAAFYSQFQQGLSAAERVFALIDADNQVVQVADNPADRLDGRIEFDAVTFAYKPGTPNVLVDFDLTIAPGESVAFVGHTGAGKSSIARLINRFYEFQSGSLRIDGHDIRSFDLRSYRSRLGVVPQMPYLFTGTIADNARYGKPDATDADIEQIAMSIGGGEWLLTLPEGLNSHVGERGSRLSMGQRQLVSLLRVLLQKPDIFILDEATASIDPFTETQIQDALDLILAQSTSILIAHRLSTVRSADRIIVLREGAIIESGDHEHLMMQGGHYAELYNTYFRHQSLNYIENARSMFAEDGAAD